MDKKPTFAKRKVVIRFDDDSTKTYELPWYDKKVPANLDDRQLESFKNASDKSLENMFKTLQEKGRTKLEEHQNRADGIVNHRGGEIIKAVEIVSDTIEYFYS